MYDKEEINAVAMLYSVTGDATDFEALLKALEPMIEKVLLRHPEVEEHWEDLKQEVLIRLWKYQSETKELCSRFSKHIPADYLFFRIRDYLKSAIKSLPHYDMYNKNIVSIDEIKDVIYYGED